jgi:hypothetical protein
MFQIQLVFKTFNLFKPNDCQKNFVDIFSPTTDVKSRVKTFCGAIADVVNSENNILYVRFFADSDARNSTFTSLFTAYREAKKNDENDGKITDPVTFGTSVNSVLFVCSLFNDAFSVSQTI